MFYNLGMNILTSESMSITDKQFMVDQGVNEIDLVKRAAQSCVEVLISDIKISKDVLIGVVCGSSNNSSDGFAIARLLLKLGYKVKVLLVGNPEKMNETCKHFYLELLADYFDSTSTEKEILNISYYVIDCIIGNGLKGELRQDTLDIVNYINKLKAKKIAIDLPTGLNANTGNPSPVCINADYTIAISNLKLGHMLSSGCDVCGKIYIADIGLNEYSNLENVETFNTKYYKEFFNRKNNSNKYDYGSVLVIGSNVSMPGAGILSSISALKMGAGLVTLACPKENYEIVASKAPYEVMIKSLDDNLLELLNKKTTVIFGPGLGRDEKYVRILEYLLVKDINLIVDADGLYLLSKIDNVKGIKQCKLVITPHIGEAATLLKKTSAEVKEDIFTSFKELINKYDCNVVLKGHNTLVGNKDKYYITTTGNSGMATAGSGDVLSGIIAGSIRKEMTLEGVAFGVYIHGLSGDYASKEVGEAPLIASDIYKNIYLALKNC